MRKADPGISAEKRSPSRTVLRCTFAVLLASGMTLPAEQSQSVFYVRAGDADPDLYQRLDTEARFKIEAEACRRWPLEAALIVHRYGRLEAGDRIVLVAVGSPHREAAFEACEFLVDWLKTKAPFWKMEETPAGEKWVGAHDDDDQAAARWEKNRR